MSSLCASVRLLFSELYKLCATELFCDNHRCLHPKVSRKYVLSTVAAEEFLFSFFFPSGKRCISLLIITLSSDFRPRILKHIVLHD